LQDIIQTIAKDADNDNRLDLLKGELTTVGGERTLNLHVVEFGSNSNRAGICK